MFMGLWDSKEKTETTGSKKNGSKKEGQKFKVLPDEIFTEGHDIPIGGFSKGFKDRYKKGRISEGWIKSSLSCVIMELRDRGLDCDLETITIPQRDEIVESLTRSMCYGHIINKVYELKLREERKVDLSKHCTYTVSEREIFFKVCPCSWLFNEIGKIHNAVSYQTAFVTKYTHRNLN